MGHNIAESMIDGECSYWLPTMFFEYIHLVNSTDGWRKFVGHRFGDKPFVQHDIKYIIPFLVCFEICFDVARVSVMLFNIMLFPESFLVICTPKVTFARGFAYIINAEKGAVGLS